MVSGLIAICLLLLCVSVCAAAEAGGAETENIPDGEADQMDISVFQLSEASLPEGFARPFSGETISEEDWWNAYEVKEAAVIPSPESIRRFSWRTAALLAEQNGGENLVYSPMSLWFCAGMMTHLTSGDAREQLLKLLDAESEEALDQQLAGAFLSMYRYDAEAACVPGASLWLDSGVSIDPAAAETLKGTDRASVFRGDMGSEAYAGALRKWLSSQTGGLLDSTVSQLRFAEGARLSVCTALYYKAAWVDPFDESRTATGIFHGTEDRETEFMRKDTDGYVYSGAHFTAVMEYLFDGSRAFFLLPKEGYAPEDLLADREALSLLEAGDDWENRSFMIIHFSMPKIDQVSGVPLDEAMKRLGVTDVFDQAKGAFDGALSADGPIVISDLKQFSRFTLDEHGIEAAAITLSDTVGAMLIDGEIDFRLDRPFLYALETDRMLPLFLGIYRAP